MSPAAPSPASALVGRLVDQLGAETARRCLDVILDRMTVVEAAALAHDWELWARPKQLAPPTTWRSWGFLTGRGFGKTLAVSQFVNEEVEAGRAQLVALAAQDEANSIAIQVLGSSGLIATSKPWFRPRWEASSLQLVWPNGARAYVRTPEVPGKIRGLDYHLSWISEIQSWPVAQRDEAYTNFLLSTRLGHARIVWDATPKKRHPILLERLRMAEEEPERHLIVRGTTYENPHLAHGYSADMERRFGTTAKGREELLGEMLTDSDAALIRQAWIDAARRALPDRFVRRVIGIDPAVTARAGNDRTGVIDAGLGVDGQAYVCGDHSGRMAPAQWAALVLDLYVRNGCDCVVVETNKGGDLVTEVLRAAAPKRGLSVVVLGKGDHPHRSPGVVYVRERHARGAKEDRAQPLATAYERGLVSHVVGVNLTELEDTITTWEPAPGQRSPDALDALVHAASELLGLLENRVDPGLAFRGLTELSRQVSAPAARPDASNLAALLGAGVGGRGGRI